MPFTPPGEYPYVNDTSPGAGDGDIVYAEIVNVIMAYLQDVLPIDISEASASDIYHAVLLGRDAPESHPADAIAVDASGFNGNLTTGDDDVQKVAQKVDDLSLGGTYTDENARDAIATALTAGSGITITPNDGADTITIAATGGGGGTTGDSEIVATSTTLTGPPHTIAVAAAGSIDITVTLPDATVDDKGLVWYIRNLNSDSVVYVANVAEGNETITESKGLLVAGIETDTPGTYVWMKVGFVSETGTITQYTDEMARDALGTALTAGTGITITPNDGSDIITVASSITQYTDELARDAIGAALVAGSGITITVNDGSDTITIDASGGSLDELQVALISQVFGG